MPRDDRHQNGDSESKGFSEPTSVLPLLVGSAIYAAYRILLVAVLNRSELPISVSERIIVALGDGMLMALLAPVALVMARRFPITPGFKVRNLLVHIVAAAAIAYLWIVSLLLVFAVVTQTPFALPSPSAGLAWFTSNAMAYALMVATVHVLAFQAAMRVREVQGARLEMQLTMARLEALKAQLEPHFLFNTLNTISELIHVQPDAAEAMVIRLGELLRFSLETSTALEIPLQRELAITGVYLDLQGMRHRDKLHVVMDIEPAAMAACVPPFILQPLVENALRHGITGRSAPGTLWVTARIEVQHLHLSVADDGVGLPLNVREGVGLGNVRHRLAEQYGVDQSLSLARRASGGTVVDIALPLRRLAAPARMPPALAG